MSEQVFLGEKLVGVGDAAFITPWGVAALAAVVGGAVGGAALGNKHIKKGLIGTGVGGVAGAALTLGALRAVFT